MNFWTKLTQSQISDICEDEKIDEYYHCSGFQNLLLTTSFIVFVTLNNYSVKRYQQPKTNLLLANCVGKENEY